MFELVYLFMQLIDTAQLNFRTKVSQCEEVFMEFSICIPHFIYIIVYIFDLSQVIHLEFECVYIWVKKYLGALNL